MTAQAGSASSPSGGPSAAERSTLRLALRRQLRAERANLSPGVRQRAARDISRQLLRHRLLKSGQRVAVYIGVRGEADLEPLITRARRLGCRLYLPRVTNPRRGTMEFLRFTGSRDLRRSGLGLLEPKPSAARIAPRDLDRVFVPLVAFDREGHRLGTGSGFYDRRFAFLTNRVRWRRPRLVGIGYELQCLPVVPTEPWDVSMDAVVTERRVYWRVSH